MRITSTLALVQFSLVTVRTSESRRTLGLTAAVNMITVKNELGNSVHVFIVTFITSSK